MSSNLSIAKYFVCACEYDFPIQNKSNKHFLFTILFFNFLKTLQASGDSCRISRSTVQILKKCPNTEEKWNEAAARRNCAEHARQCSEPEKLEYHCVINPFINQTLEVCAYAQNIVLGQLFIYDRLNSN